MDLNKIVSIQSLENLTSLETLYLTSNLIESLQGLEKLIKIRELYLSFNKILSFQQIENFTLLTKLYLQYNQIESILPIKKMSSLQILNLNSNKIRFINGTDKLTVLGYIYLDYNLIESLPNMINLKLLRELYLKSNQISTLSGIEKRTSLWALDLSYNKIKSLFGLGSFSNLQLFDLTSNSIESVTGLVNTQSLISFDLKNNNITKLETSYFNKVNFVSLVSVILTNNRIRLLVNYTFNNIDVAYINIDDNLIETIECFAFYKLYSVKIISLKNNQIKIISDFSFTSPIMNNLVAYQSKVDLSSSFNLTKIFPYSFSRFDTLTISYISLVLLKEYNSSYFNISTLDLSNNGISTLFQNTINGKCNILNLENNMLVNFENESFFDVANLKEISFAKNLIRNLDFSNAFKSTQTKLTKLDFRLNKIISISNDFFVKFPNLLNLDLAKNDFFSIEKDFFLNLQNLKSLSLSDNQILSIEIGSFSHLCSLNHLDLRNNLIYDLKNGTIFENLTNLTELILSHNKLESISKQNFESLFNLKVLDLRENEIKSILDADLFESIENLNFFYLGSNQIKSLVNFNNIQNLDLSSNSFNFINISSLNSNLVYLDLSNNDLNQTRNFDFSVFNRLKILNLSKIDSIFLLNTTKFSSNSTLEELNLNFNNLTLLNVEFFTNLINLKQLFLRETNLINFDFLSNLKLLLLIDLSDNIEYYNRRVLNGLSSKLIHIQLSNTSYLSVKNLLRLSIDNFNVSHNSLTIFDYTDSSLTRFLDMSYNQFEFFFTSEIEAKYFSTLWLNLNYINLAKSLTKPLANKIFYFNKFLEFGVFSENFLNTLPKFCQSCPYSELVGCINSFILINFKCMLRMLFFDSNNLNRIYFRDLYELENLEILNLDNNQISFIEENSFSKLNKLETLILSRNQLPSFHNGSIDLFNSLVNLKLLNLSSNSIEIISRFLFNQLFKLETLDLSFNRIASLESYSFHMLVNMRNLFLNNNAFEIQIENDTFIQLNVIQNIYISASILTEKTNGIFLNLFKNKNSNFSKVVLKRHLYKSLFLLANYSQYDCNMTLFFIENNVHYNFKTESNIFDYFSECSQMRIKNESQILNVLISDRDEKIFSNIFYYMFNLTLLFILFMGFTCFLVVKKKESLMIQ